MHPHSCLDSLCLCLPLLIPSRLGPGLDKAWIAVIGVAVQEEESCKGGLRVII